MKADSVSSGFRNVDASGDQAFFIDYLKFIDSVPEFRAIKERNYKKLKLKSGTKVLDAGCGIGLDTYRLGSRVGDPGSVIGFDSSEAMISVAQKNTPDNVKNISFKVGDLMNPPFPDDTFDAVYLERVLQIVPDPKEILGQLKRMVKPGGTIMSIEPDWGTMALDPGNRNTIRTLISCCADTFPDGWTGRKLYHLFRDIELDVQVEAEPVIMHDFQTINRAMNFEKFISGAIQEGQMIRNDADELVEGFKRADKSGNFFFSYMIYRAVAKKPKKS